MIINVPLDYISDNRFQCRQDYGDVEGLAADIAANGLLQIPIGRLLDADGETVVMPHNLPAFSITDLFELRGCRVELAFGHRRKRAWAHLDARGGGWTLMPVDVRPLDDDQMLNHVWSENQRRSDINAIEQAELLAEKLERARAALLILLAALLLALAGCGAWEDGASSATPTPGGYIWIPGVVGTPAPLATVSAEPPTLEPSVTATEIPWTQTMRAIAPPTPPVTPVVGEAAAP